MRKARNTLFFRNSDAIVNFDEFQITIYDNSVNLSKIAFYRRLHNLF